MRNSVDANLQEWDREHEWSADGDEWSGMAAYCKQPYPQWKSSLVETFLSPYVSGETDALEIAPGHGRWADTLTASARTTTLVDLSPSCIAFCKERFGDRDGVTYIVNDGLSLPGVADDSIDFAWSFDSFVHMQPDVVAAYLHELARVLRPGGLAVIHHAGRRDAVLPVARVRTWGQPGRFVFSLASLGRPRDGWRSDLSRRIFNDLVAEVGLVVAGQTQTWGPRQQYTVGRYNDWVTTVRKPG